MKIYYVKRNDYKRRNVSLIVPYLGAYVDEKMANMAIALYWALVRDIDTDLFVESSDIKEYPVKRHVYYMDIYNGYDYDYSDGSTFDRTVHSEIYPNLHALKESSIYQQHLKLKKNFDPNDFIELPDGSMGWRDSCFDDLFSYGDCFEGKWSIRIEKLRVYKGDEDGLKDFLINRSKKLDNPQLLY